MSSKLDLDPGVIEDCRQAAAQIAASVAEEIAGKTTVSVERTIARLLGVDGANELDVPLPNVLVDHVRERGGLDKGIAYWLGNAMLQREELSPARIAEAVAVGELDLCALPSATEEAIRERISGECERRLLEQRCDTERCLQRNCAGKDQRAGQCRTAAQGQCDIGGMQQSQEP